MSSTKPSKAIYDISENDILMGRGGKNHEYDGNEQLRKIARGCIREYKTSTKKQKAVISRRILSIIKKMNPPGRFIKKDYNKGYWFEVDDSDAREKICQVLRDAVSNHNGSSSTSSEKRGETKLKTSPRTKPAGDEEDDCKPPPLPSPESIFREDDISNETEEHHYSLFSALASSSIEPESNRKVKVCDDDYMVPIEPLPHAMECIPSEFSPQESHSMSNIELFSPPKTTRNSGIQKSGSESAGLALVTPNHRGGGNFQGFGFGDMEDDVEANIHDYAPKSGLSDDFDLFNGTLRNDWSDEKIENPDQSSKVEYL